MAPPPGPNRSPSGGPLAAFGRMIGFTSTAGMAVVLLAAVVWLPAWQRREDARAQRDALAAKTDAHTQLIEHNERLIGAIKANPLLTEKQLMEQQNFRRPGEVAVELPDPPPDEQPVIDRLAARDAKAAEPPSTTLTALAEHVENPRTRRGLLLLSGLLFVAAMVLFGPPPSGRDGGGKAKPRTKR